MLAFRLVSRTTSRCLFSLSSNATTSRCSQFWLRPAVVCASNVTCFSTTSAKPSGTSLPSADVPLEKLSPEELGKLIYKAPSVIHSTVRNTKFLSITSTVLALTMVPMTISKLGERALEQPAILAGLIVGNIFFCLLALTPALLQLLVRRYTIEMYYNKDTNTFTSVHYNFFLKRRAYRFRPEEVVDAEAGNSNPYLFSLATIVVRGRPLLFPVKSTVFYDLEAFDKLTRTLKVIDQ